MQQLGKLYAEGKGDSPDYVKAYAWWTVAAVAGKSRAEKNLERLALIMSEADIRRAKRLAREIAAKLPIDW